MEATQHVRTCGFFFLFFYLQNLSMLRQKPIHMSLKIIQRIGEEKIIQFYISNWRPSLVR